MKKPKNISTYYKSKGTPIYRDTTALPFDNGGPTNTAGPRALPTPTVPINLENLQNIYPVFRNLQDVELTADPTFTSEKTGFGNIEYISPTRGDEPIRYPTGYELQVPKPGAHNIVYNPNENTIENVKLDLFSHGLREADPTYQKYLEEFTDEYKKAHGKTMDHWYKEDEAAGYAEDGREAWDNNYIDGVLRGIFHSGTMAEKFEDRYNPTEFEDTTKNHPELISKINQIRTYLETPQLDYLQKSLELPKKFVEGGPLVDKTNHGKLFNSVYASALGNYYNLGGGMDDPPKGPSKEEVWKATMDWINANPYTDMPDIKKLETVETSMYPAMRGSRIHVPVAQVYANPYNPNIKEDYQWQKVEMPEGYTGLDVYMVNGKPMVLDKEFNENFLTTYKKKKLLGKDEIFHVYGRGVPYSSTTPTEVIAPTQSEEFKNGGQFSRPYSLPEDSFMQGGNNLHNSVYASSPAQYPAVYKYGGSFDMPRQQMYMPLDNVERYGGYQQNVFDLGGSLLSMSNTPELSGEGKDLTYPNGAYVYNIGGNMLYPGMVNIPIMPEATLSDPPNKIKINPAKKSDPNYIKGIQQQLVGAGYELPKYGVDGLLGPETQTALDAYNKGIAPEPSGWLPTFYGTEREEFCDPEKGCSFNVSKKLGNILGPYVEGDFWAGDSWFNRDTQLRNKGKLIYSTDERDVAKMPTVPKELWKNLRVGDYVHLNRSGDPRKNEVYEKDPSLKNENIEHLGFIVGKDKDGTPLIWHGSETGKAYIKRIDEPITLDDHQFLGAYQVASIVRNPAMVNVPTEELKRIQESEYYKPLDANKKLIVKDKATEAQKTAAKFYNTAQSRFKNLGYPQEDVLKVGQLLIGGIMQNESSGDTSYKRPLKQAAAYLAKDVAGVAKSFERDEASWGVYQMKGDYNFKNEDGSLNALGKKLKIMGVDPDAIFDSVENQTIAGGLILLDNYERLKKDPDFNEKTGMYKSKDMKVAVPASYILAKSWQAGSGWQDREKYKEFLKNIDIDYSGRALRGASDAIGTSGVPHDATYELNYVNSQIEKKNKQIAPLAIKFEEEQKKAEEEKQEIRANDPILRRIPSESTAISPTSTYYPTIRNPYQIRKKY